jgi:hypothetical protein
VAYLKSEWLDDDEHSKALQTGAWYTANSKSIDDQILADAEGVGLDVSEIVLDVDGCLTQKRLIALGVAFCMYRGFSSKWGIRDSSTDIYGAKKEEWKAEYFRLRGELSRLKVLYA